MYEFARIFDRFATEATSKSSGQVALKLLDSLFVFR